MSESKRRQASATSLRSLVDRLPGGVPLDLPPLPTSPSTAITTTPAKDAPVTHPLPDHAKAKWQQIKQRLSAAQQPILAEWGAYVEATLAQTGLDLTTSRVAVREEEGVYVLTPVAAA